MRPVKNALVAAWLGLALAACADSTGPVPGSDTIGLGPTAGNRVAYTKTTTTTAPADTAIAVLTPLSFAAGTPPLTTYDTVFVFKQGKDGTHKIFFKGVGVGADTVPFMRLTIPKAAQFVDGAGNPLPDGQKVNLTVHVDSLTLSIQFGPHGSTFTKKPAILELNYGRANLKGLDPGTLTVWYQPEVNTSWSVIPTTVDIVGKWLTISLDHFSNYAVAYRK
jgi:hypothetical protein